MNVTSYLCIRFSKSISIVTGNDCRHAHRCHRCGDSEHTVTDCDADEPPTLTTPPPSLSPRADDMGITDDNLSDTDTKLAQAEVFALSAGERRGQRPAIDILRALASLPYGNDGELQIRSLTEALQEVELDTTRTVRDPITARSNVGNHGTALRPTLLRPAPHHRCRDTNWEWMRRTGYSLMMQRELAGLGEAWRQRGLH